MNHTSEYLRGRGPDDRSRKYVPVTNSTRKKNKSDKSGEHPIRLCVAMHLIILCDYFCFVTLFILTFLLLTARNQHVITFVSRYVIHAHVGHAVTNESCNNKEQP